tara:strand:- start:488 stop:2188 length:1701 start_codon:yes stop_codon:yes gene_type:complete
MNFGDLYSRYIDPNARGLQPGKPGPSQSIGTGGSRSQFKQNVDAKIKGAPRLLEQRLGRYMPDNFPSTTPVVPRDFLTNPNAEQQFNQQYKLENPNQGSSRVTRSREYRGLKAKQNFLRDIGTRIRSGGGFGYTGALQGTGQGLLMTGAGWAGQKFGEYLGDQLTDATVRTLDATVGLTIDGQQVDYDPVTNQFIKVKQQQQTSQNQSQGTSGVVNAFGLSFDMSDPKQKAAYDKLQAEKLKELRKKRDERLRLNPNPDPDSDPDRLIITDQDKRTNAFNLSQTGRDGSKLLARHEEEKKSLQESGIGNSLLQRLGIDTVQYGQFESNHLPGEQETAGKPQKTNVDAELSGQTPAQYLDSGQSTTKLEELPTKETNLVESGEIQASNPAQLGSRARYKEEFLAKGRSGMEGMRAAEASKGLLYASGKYWQETGEKDADGKPKYTEISRDDYRSIKSGEQHAIDFARDKIELVKSVGKQPNFEEVQRDAKEFDFGSDVYGGNQGSAPKAADYPEQSALSPYTTTYHPNTSTLGQVEKQAVELTGEPFSVMNSSEEKLREQLRAIKKR